MGPSESGNNEEQRLKKGSWGPEESALLFACVEKYGVKNWSQVAEKSGLSRSGKSCRLRWQNYLKPGLNRAPFTGEEEELIYRLHLSMGNKWAKIATALPGRTDNDIKNHWNTHMKTKLKRAGRDPAARAALSEEEIASIFRTGNDTSIAAASADQNRPRKKRHAGKSPKVSHQPAVANGLFESSSPQMDSAADDSLDEIFLLLSIPEESEGKSLPTANSPEALDLCSEEWNPVKEVAEVSASIPTWTERWASSAKESIEVSASFPSLTEEMSSEFSYGNYLTPEVNSANPSQANFYEDVFFHMLGDSEEKLTFDDLNDELLLDDKMDIDNLEAIEDEGWTFKVSPQKKLESSVISDLNQETQFYFVSTIQSFE